MGHAVDIATLRRQVEELTKQIRNHTGTASEKHALKRKRLRISQRIYDQNIRIREQLEQPATQLDAARKEGRVPADLQHAVLVAVELMRTVPNENLAFAARRAARRSQ